MIWFTHKKYTPEYFARRLAAIYHDARMSMRSMTLLAGASTFFMVVMNITWIYGR